MLVHQADGTKNLEVSGINDRIFDDEAEKSDFERRKHEMNSIVGSSIRYEDRVAQCKGPCGEGMKLFTVWTTGASWWNSKYTHSIDSALFHHPKAEVSIYSSSLPSDFLADFSALGYNVSVHRLDLATRARGTPLEPWANQLDKWYDGPFYYAHLSDAVRMLVLYNEGGIYFDTDVVFINPMDAVKNSIGWERSDSLCNALMSFEARNQYLKVALQEFTESYVMDDWAANGPALLTRVYEKDFQHSSEVRALKQSAFYLISWDEVQRFFEKESEVDRKRDMHVVTSGTYVVHFWNSRSHDLLVHPES